MLRLFRLEGRPDALAAVLAAALLVVGMAAPTTRRVQWGLSRHFPPLPTSPHASAREVPPYPLDDSTLTDPHAWPNKALTELGPCDLRVLAGEGDSIQQGQSLSDVPPGHTLGLSYDCPPHVGPIIGPAYTWDAKGWLSVRSWGRFESDAYVWREWNYYKSGELFSYTHQVWPKSLDGDPKALEECFDRGGNLLGYSLTHPGTLGPSARAVQWNGRDVSDEDFKKTQAEISNQRGETTRRVDWKLSREAPPVPGSAHASAGDVPHYPFADPSLTNPRAWPNRVLTELGTCELKVSAGDGTSFQSAKSVDEVAPGQVLGLSYDCPPHSDPVVGPASTWDEQGRPQSRSWGTFQGDGYAWRVWSYYKTGELLGYLHQLWPKTFDTPTAALEEYFDKGGKLLGFALIRPGSSGAPEHVFRWMGKEMGEDDFGMAHSDISMKRE